MILLVKGEPLYGKGILAMTFLNCNYYTVVEVKLSGVRQSEITKEPILSAMRINLGFRKRDGQTVNPLPPRSSPLMCKIVWC